MVIAIKKNHRMNAIEILFLVSKQKFQKHGGCCPAVGNFFVRRLTKEEVPAAEQHQFSNPKIFCEPGNFEKESKTLREKRGLKILTKKSVQHKGPCFVVWYQFLGKYRPFCTQCTLWVAFIPHEH